MKFLLLLLVSFLLFTTRASGQATAPQAQQQNNALKYGFGYFGFYKFSRKWGMHLDVQFRQDENLAQSVVNLYRGGLIRYLKPNLYVAGGYGFFNIHSEIFEDHYQEHRIHEQITYSRKNNLIDMRFRFRVEQRFVEKLKFSPAHEAITDHFTYGNRLRLFNRTTYDLTRKPEAENVLYVALQDELFLSFGAPEINRNFLDQNRFYVIFGVFKDQNTRLETSYENIFLHPHVGKSRFAHYLHFTIIQHLDFSRPE